MQGATMQKMRGCHGNHQITHSLNGFIFEYIRVLDSVDPNGHFGTHEKKSRGGVHGRGQWPPEYYLP